MSFLDKARPLGSRGQGIIFGTAKRLYNRVLPLAMSNWGEQLARLPWTSDETKAQVTARYGHDEGIFMRASEELGSEACCIYNYLAPNRPILRSAYRALGHERAAQAALSSLICAARLKYYGKKGALLDVLCPSCQKVGSFIHLLQCVMVTAIHREEEELVKFLKILARILEPMGKFLPQPIHAQTAGEIILGWLDFSEEELSLSTT